MRVYLVTCTTTGHEQYRVEAESEAHAQMLVEEGEAGTPVLAEVLDVQVDNVSEEE